MKTNKLTRRNFIASTSAGAAGAMLSPPPVCQFGLRSELRTGFEGRNTRKDHRMVRLACLG